MKQRGRYIMGYQAVTNCQDSKPVEFQFFFYSMVSIKLSIYAQYRIILWSEIPISLWQTIPSAIHDAASQLDVSL